MFYPVKISLVPKHVRTLASFTALDPWNGGPPTPYTLDAYQLALTCP